MPDFASDRDTAVQTEVSPGGNFYLALNGPTGEATEVVIGIECVEIGCPVIRHFDADKAEDIANHLLEQVRILRECR